jgi:hypothetical protein
MARSSCCFPGTTRSSPSTTEQCLCWWSAYRELSRRLLVLRGDTSWWVFLPIRVVLYLAETFLSGWFILPRLCLVVGSMSYNWWAWNQSIWIWNSLPESERDCQGETFLLIYLVWSLWYVLQGWRKSLADRWLLITVDRNAQCICSRNNAPSYGCDDWNHFTLMYVLFLTSYLQKQLADLVRPHPKSFVLSSWAYCCPRTAHQFSAYW